MEDPSHKDLCGFLQFNGLEVLNQTRNIVKMRTYIPNSKLGPHRIWPVYIHERSSCNGQEWSTIPLLFGPGSCFSAGPFKSLNRLAVPIFPADKNIDAFEVGE